MNIAAPQINLLAAWLGILLGFVSGMVMGMFFHREDWLGGYASHKRRLYRLGHISFFGLGAVNLFFWLMVKGHPEAEISVPVGLTFVNLDGCIFENILTLASHLFVIGAVTMPLCCVLMAHWPKLHLAFAVPVIGLITAAVLTLILILGDADAAAINHQLSTIQTK
jgi:hypothetical protein